MSKLSRFLIAIFLAIRVASSSHAFDIVYTIEDEGAYTPYELAALQTGLAQAEWMWETVITGYRPGINIASVPITVGISEFPGAVAVGGFTTTTNQGGFTLTTAGTIQMTPAQIDLFADWEDVGANGLNFMDEILAHETGHALGIGTLWTSNNVYSLGSFQYTGQYGVAAYQAEFDPSSPDVPVENAGAGGTMNSHWDQLMRSSSLEGNPNDPWPLDPRVGVVDHLGRDRGLELMTGAIDPDYLEPFLSLTTIQSMRDLGYTVAAPEDFNGDGVVDLADRNILMQNFGATGLQIDSIAFGDADRNRIVNMADLLLWQTAAGVSEPGSLALAAIALLAVRRVRL